MEGGAQAHLATRGLDIKHQVLERPLVPMHVIVVLAVLLHGHIRQVDIGVVHVTEIRTVLHGAEACESMLVPARNHSEVSAP